MEEQSSAAQLLRERLGDNDLIIEEKDGELRVDVSAEALPKAAKLLREEPELAYDFLADLAAYDTGEEFVLWYRLHSMTHNRTAIMRLRLGREAPVAPSVTGVWPVADWFERECFDMYGIDFEGHPFRGDIAQMRILLPRDWEGFPFRKDYEPVFSGDPLHGPQETN